MVLLYTRIKLPLPQFRRKRLSSVYTYQKNRPVAPPSLPLALPQRSADVSDVSRVSVG